MIYDRNQIDRIKAANPIEEVIGDEISLKRCGQSMVGHCPFCSGKKPKLTVTSGKAMWFCFRCDKGGDVVKWIMLTRTLTFQEALAHLAQRACISP